MKSIARSHAGFAAMAAIFLLVVLAALGAFMLTFSNTQQLNSAADIQGSRAYWAARAGLAWGIGSIAAQPAATATCPASPTTLPGGSASFDGGFTVAVTCAPATYNEAGTDRRVFQFTAVAQTVGAPGNPGFVERSLTATLER